MKHETLYIFTGNGIFLLFYFCPLSACSELSFLFAICRPLLCPSVFLFVHLLSVFMDSLLFLFNEPGYLTCFPP